VAEDGFIESKLVMCRLQHQGRHTPICALPLFRRLALLLNLVPDQASPGSAQAGCVHLPSDPNGSKVSDPPTSGRSLSTAQPHR